MGGRLRNPFTPVASLAYGTTSKCCGSTSDTKITPLPEKKTKSSQTGRQRRPEVCWIRGSPVHLWLRGLFGKEMNSANAEVSPLDLEVSPGGFVPPRRTGALQTPRNRANICVFCTANAQSKRKAKSLKYRKLSSGAKILKSCFSLSFVGR